MTVYAFFLHATLAGLVLCTTHSRRPEKYSIDVKPIGDSNAISMMEFDATGKYLAAGSLDKSFRVGLRFYRLDSKANLVRKIENVGRVQKILRLPQGGFALLRDRSLLILRSPADANPRKIQLEMPQNANPLDAAVSPDGSRIFIVGFHGGGFTHSYSLKSGRRGFATRTRQTLHRILILKDARRAVVLGEDDYYLLDIASGRMRLKKLPQPSIANSRGRKFTSPSALGLFSRGEVIGIGGTRDHLYVRDLAAGSARWHALITYMPIDHISVQNRITRIFFLRHASRVLTVHDIADRKSNPLNISYSSSAIIVWDLARPWRKRIVAMRRLDKPTTTAYHEKSGYMAYRHGTRLYVQSLQSVRSDPVWTKNILERSRAK